MTYIENRQQLITWLEDNAPPSTLRAVRDSQVELLGLFDPIPTSSNPGWILIVTSMITKRTWNVVVSMQLKKPFYYTWMIEKVPWGSWIGDVMDNPLHHGDRPKKYYGEMAKEVKNESMKKAFVGQYFKKPL